jgi:Na+/H+ antiporter NhaA
MAAMTRTSASSLRGRTAWARNLGAPLRDFLKTETGGAVVLLAATVAALAWANSPWSDSYASVWGTQLSIRLGDAVIAMDLRDWVNEGLMTFFFLVVGLEAKREVELGQLRERRRLAALAVMSVVAAASAVGLYLVFNAGGAGAQGWGAAMSTDTAFVLGVLALVAPNGTRLRVRLLTMAVVDDLVALVVIATVYTEHVSLAPLAVAAGLSLPWSRSVTRRWPGALRRPSFSAWRCGSPCASPGSTRSSRASPSGSRPAPTHLRAPTSRR